VPITRDDCLALDTADVLAPLRRLFALDRADARGEIYLDGNSLGALPRATAARLRAVIESEWGGGLIRSWNDAGWIALSQRVAEKIARLIDATPDQVAVTDGTSINLFKVLTAAIDIAAARGVANRHVLTERSNFPSDLYIAESATRRCGFDLVLAETADLDVTLADNPAVLLLTHVNYHTGRMHHVPAVTRAAHEAGALVIWDLSHSAGVVPLAFSRSDGDAPDFAVGCGYKFLNGGPGAPAFIWVHPDHLAWMNRTAWQQPLPGWLGHARPFDFDTAYRPAAGIGRFHCGTPPILSLAALECGVDTCLAAVPHGGVEAIRQKSVALTDLFIALLDQRAGRHELRVVSPRDGSARGSQVSISHPSAGYAIVQALIARGVIGDFRAPDVLRFGMAPLYTRFVDMWDAVERVVDVLETGAWREPRFNVRAVVT
jgi:kynureninase